ncbi:MAG: hypothetical protein J4G19_06225 [Pseudomonadales bacterium]|nr:hypothetical protein [Pseudomonadales bacterium]
MSDSKTTPRSVNSLEDVVRRIASCDLHGSSRLWLAFSGGVDSTVLLHAAARAFESDQLAVVHVNHGLSPNADAWELHCEEVLIAFRSMARIWNSKVGKHGRVSSMK